MKVAIRDTYVISAEVFSGSTDVEPAAQSSTRTCVCSYNDSAFFEAPTASLQTKESIKIPDVFLNYCNHDESLVLPDSSTPAGEFVFDVLAEYCYLVTNLNIRAPLTATQLSPAAWTVARLSQAAGECLVVLLLVALDACTN